MSVYKKLSETQTFAILTIYFGFTTTEKAEEWRTRKLKVLHLIAGVIMLLLGVFMFVAMGLGVFDSMFIYYSNQLL